MLAALKSKKNNQGFTLVEGLVVVALIGILSVVGIPSLQTAITKTKVRTSANTIKQGLVFAREQAISRSRRVQFMLTDETDLTSLTPITAANGRNWVAITLPNADITGDNRNNIGGEKIIDADNTTIAVNGPNSLTFNALGRPTATTPTYSIRVKEIETYRVEVSTSGRVKACDPTPNAYSDKC